MQWARQVQMSWQQAEEAPLQLPLHQLTRVAEAVRASPEVEVLVMGYYLLSVRYHWAVAGAGAVDQV